MSRLLALVAAVAMVVGAFALREWLDARPAPEVPSEPSTSLVCAAELGAACERLAETEGLEVRTAAAGDTVIALAANPDAAPDLWLVPAPWPEVAQIRRGGDPAGAPEVSQVLARSPLVLVGFTERLETLEEFCSGEVTWRCIGEQAGTPWSELGLPDAGAAVLRPGHRDPTTSAAGLLVLGQAAAAFFGGTDLNRGDLDSEDFAAWFTRLESAIPEFSPASGSMVTDMLTRGPASYDVVGTTEAEATQLLEAAPAGPRPIEVRPSSPPASADVVLVAFDGDVEGALERVGEPLRAALADTGWKVEADPSLPEDAGLPSAGFLVALQERWEEVAP
jgi:hypothetical protein